MTRRSLLLAVAQAFLPVHAERFEFSAREMGTIARIVLYSAEATSARSAADSAFARIAALDNTLSDYKDSSELMQLCHRAGGPAVKISDDLFRVLRQAQQIAAASGGAFDVTAGPLVRLWRRARRQHELPDKADLARARALTGYRKLYLDAVVQTARLELPGMLLDLGGIAKGYAASEALQVLRQSGISAALVAVGGDIAVSDAPPDGAGWRVEVAPLLPGAPAPILLLRNQAVSTSGDAEQYTEIRGRRYSHIVDPRTGRAVQGRSSVTVVAPDGALADSLATAASVLGRKKGLRLVDRFNATAALFSSATTSGRIQRFESHHWDAIVKATHT